MSASEFVNSTELRFFVPSAPVEHAAVGMQEIAAAGECPTVKLRTFTDDASGQTAPGLPAQLGVVERVLGLEQCVLPRSERDVSHPAAD